MIHPVAIDPPHLVLITRMEEHTWIFEGEWACLTSQLGNIMVDDTGDPFEALGRGRPNETKRRSLQ